MAIENIVRSGNSPIVRSITVPAMGSSGVDLKNKSIAGNLNMVRVDVFKKDNKFYLVPIYAKDFSKKAFPNKAIIAGKNENDWIEMTPEYEFLFSLYPYDLVKVKDKNEAELITYYKGTDRSNGRITVLIHPNANTKLIKRFSTRNLEIFEKYQVDILGNISKVKKENRIYNIRKVKKEGDR